MSAIGKFALLVLVLFAVPVGAEEPTEDAPAIVQATANFSNALGTGSFAVAWSLSANDVPLDSEIALTLVVEGASNPHRVRRPDLVNRPSFKAAFRQISNGNDPPATREAKSVLFTYRLRARSVGSTAVPELPFVYFHPPSGELRTKYLDAIPLMVRAAVVAPVAVRPLEAPARFFEWPSGELPSRTLAPPGLRHWVGLLLGLVILSLVWVAFWRWRNPDGPRLALLRQNRAVQKALRGLAQAEREPEPAAAIQRAFETYLMERFGFWATAPVPSELEVALKNVELPTARIEAAIQLLRRCEAARFSQPADDAPELVRESRNWILSGELDK